MATFAACGGAKPAAPALGRAAGQDTYTPPPVHKNRAREPRTGARAPIATIGHRAIGPFVARSGDAGIVAWVTSGPRGSGQEVDVVPVGPDGGPLAAPTAVATLADSTDGVSTLVVRASGSTRGGWLLAWSALMDRGEGLTVLALDARGQPRGAPVEVQRTADHLAWFDFIPTPAGAICAWAEETSAGAANLVAVAVDADGKPTGLPARVARGVSRWDVAGALASRSTSAASSSEGLALVEVADGAKAGAPGSLSWQLLDADGHPVARELPIGATPNVSSDVDVVATPNAGWLVGWTDRTTPDAQVTLVYVDAEGHVSGPARPLEAAGSSSLVALASGPAGSLLAWESPRAAAHPERALRLTQVAADGSVPPAQKGIALEVVARSQPEVVATETGFALLVAAHVCLAGQPPQAPGGRASCTGPLSPTFVRLGADLEPLQTEPIALGDYCLPATLAWGLACTGDHCTALAADGAKPTTVYGVDFAPRPSQYAAPTVPALPTDAPRATGLMTVASGQVFSDLVTARMGDDTLLAALSLPSTARTDDPDPHAQGRGKASGAATISLYTLDGGGHPVAPPTTVSARAVASGGLAIAPALRPDDGAALAWVKRDSGDPQVHLALVDRHGKRLREVQLTSAKGDAGSVSIVAVEGGWLVAWVDGRNRGGEVYAVRVDAKLDKISREVRVTSAAGDPSDVTLAVTPGDPSRVWLAWSDSRESPSEGLGDIFVAQLRAQDASRAGDEVRLLATAHHSRSPQIVPWPAGTDGGGAVVAWLEEGPAGLESPSAVMLARVDAGGHRVGDANKLPLPTGSTPTGVTLSLDDGPRRIARAIVARSSGGAVTLEATRIGADALEVGSPSSLLELEAQPPFDVSAALSGDAVYFDDSAGESTDHRVRRAAVDWRRASVPRP